MSDLVELLRGVFGRHGFDVRPIDSSASVVVARPGDVALVHVAERAPDFTALANEADAAGAARVIVLSLVPDAPTAAPEGFEVWPRGRFAQEVGETVLSFAAPQAAPAPATNGGPGGARGATVPAPEPNQHRSLVARASSGSQYSSLGVHFLPSKPTRSAEPVRGTSILPNAFSGHAAGMAPNASLSRDERRARDAVAMPMPGKPTRQVAGASPAVALPPVAQEAPAARPEAARRTAMVRGREVDLEPNEDVEIILSKPRTPASTDGEYAHDAPVLETVVAKETAQARAGDQVGKVRRVSLELVPHHAFAFDVNLAVAGLDAPIAGRGTVLANAVTGALTRVSDVTTASRKPKDAQVALARFDVPDVYGPVKSMLVKEFTRDVKLTRVIEDVEMEEAKRVVPSPTDLHMEPGGTVLAPVWIVEGENGRVEIDAFVAG